MALAQSFPCGVRGCSSSSWAYSCKLATGVLVWWEISEIRALICSFCSCKFLADRSLAARYRPRRHSSADRRLSSKLVSENRPSMASVSISSSRSMVHSVRHRLSSAAASKISNTAPATTYPFIVLPPRCAQWAHPVISRPVCRVIFSTSIVCQGLCRRSSSISPPFLLSGFPRLVPRSIMNIRKSSSFL